MELLTRIYDDIISITNEQGILREYETITNINTLKPSHFWHHPLGGKKLGTVISLFIENYSKFVTLKTMSYDYNFYPFDIEVKDGFYH
jgi:hypothetical protein